MCVPCMKTKVAKVVGDFLKGALWEDKDSPPPTPSLCV